MFDPTTFVPREKDGQKANHAEENGLKACEKDVII